MFPNILYYGPAHLTVLKNLFNLRLCSFSKSFKSMAGPSYPKHDPAHFKTLKNVFVLILCSLSKTFKFMAGPCTPTSATRPSRSYDVEEPFRLDVMQPFKNSQVCGWAVHSNIPTHCPAHFTVLKTHFVFMFCSLSKTLKYMAEPCSQTSPIATQLISRC